MVGNEKTEQRDQVRGRPLLPRLAAALIGAVLVLGIAGGLGGLIEELAAPAVLAGFAAVGAIFGALAWGAVDYDRRHRPPIGGAG
jgi:membrane associated rhomboid family serine protease